MSSLPSSDSALDFLGNDFLSSWAEGETQAWSFIDESDPLIQIGGDGADENADHMYGSSALGGKKVRQNSASYGASFPNYAVYDDMMPSNEIQAQILQHQKEQLSAQMQLHNVVQQNVALKRLQMSGGIDF